MHELRDPEPVRLVRHDAAPVRERAEDSHARARFDRRRDEHDVRAQELLVGRLDVPAQVHGRVGVESRPQRCGRVVRADHFDVEALRPERRGQLGEDLVHEDVEAGDRRDPAQVPDQ